MEIRNRREQTNNVAETVLEISSIRFTGTVHVISVAKIYIKYKTGYLLEGPTLCFLAPGVAISSSESSCSLLPLLSMTGVAGESFFIIALAFANLKASRK